MTAAIQFLVNPLDWQISRGRWPYLGDYFGRSKHLKKELILSNIHTQGTSLIPLVWVHHLTVPKDNEGNPERSFSLGSTQHPRSEPLSFSELTFRANEVEERRVDRTPDETCHGVRLRARDERGWNFCPFTINLTWGVRCCSLNRSVLPCTTQPSIGSAFSASEAKNLPTNSSSGGRQRWRSKEQNWITESTT